MRRTITFVFATAMAALAGATSVHAQATSVTTNEQVPVTVFAFVPCANGGAGELVLLEGTLHVLTHVTIDDQGGLHVTQHFQPQGVSGTGVTQSQFNATAGFEQTDINNFRVIGQGPDNNLLVHSTFHVTVTPNGDVTTVVDNFSVECR
jgi:hypothetical protein